VRVVAFRHPERAAKRRLKARPTARKEAVCLLAARLPMRALVGQSHQEPSRQPLGQVVRFLPDPALTAVSRV